MRLTDKLTRLQIQLRLYSYKRIQPFIGGKLAILIIRQWATVQNRFYRHQGRV